MACHTYESSHGTLPIGHRGILQADRRSFTGWLYDILPHMEQNNLFTLYDNTVPNLDPKNAVVRTSFVKSYVCPSDINQNKLFTPETEASTGGGGSHHPEAAIVIAQTKWDGLFTQQ